MLDAIIRAISPAAAYRRQVWRDALARYEGARNSRRTRGWRTDASGPNLEVRDGLTTLRDRSRDLVRNNAWAAAGLDIVVAHQVGYGITPRSRTGDAETDKRVNAEFEAWAKACDIGGRRCR